VVRPLRRQQRRQTGGCRRLADGGAVAALPPSLGFVGTVASRAILLCAALLGGAKLRHHGGEPGVPTKPSDRVEQPTRHRRQQADEQPPVWRLCCRRSGRTTPENSDAAN